MKITVLMENTTRNPDLKAEHGLSLYIEANGRRILFDMGQSDGFADNAKAMGIDLGQADVAVLSHGHYDHGGGLKRFLELNQKAPVYIADAAFEPHYSGERYIGLDPELKNNPRLISVPDEYAIEDHLTLVTWNQCQRPYPTDSFGLKMCCKGKLIADDFRHEQYLMVEENGKKVLISGCSHKGILNVMSWAASWASPRTAPDALIGGFHFMKLNTQTEKDCHVLDAAAKTLKTYKTRYYTCHCTGMTQYEYLKERMGEQLGFLGAGDVLIVDSNI